MGRHPHTMELVVPDLCSVECSQGVGTALQAIPSVCELQVLSVYTGNKFAHKGV